MQKILLFVLVILIVNVQSVDVYTQASIDKLVNDASAAASTAASKAALSKQDKENADKLVTTDLGEITTPKETLTKDNASQKETQDSYSTQLAATEAAQHTADTNRKNLVAAHALVEANVLVVKALNVRKAAMVWTEAQTNTLTTDRGALNTAVGNAETTLTKVKTSIEAWLGQVTTAKTNLGVLATLESDVGTKNSAQTSAAATVGPQLTGSAVCNSDHLATYYTAAEAWIAAGVKHATAVSSSASYDLIISEVGTKLTGQMNTLLAKQGAVKDAANALTYVLNNVDSVLWNIQDIITKEQGRVSSALETANAATLTLATALQNANSLATSSDSVWLQSKQLLATQLTALQSIESKTVTAQFVYDKQYSQWMKSQNAAYVSNLAAANDAAAEKETADYETLSKQVQVKVNVALATDKETATKAEEVVVAAAAKVTSDVAAALKVVTEAAEKAHAAGVASTTAAVKSAKATKHTADDALGLKWNNSLKADATTLKAACDAEIKKEKDANKSSTKLNFSVLSLIAGLLIMTMN